MTQSADGTESLPPLAEGEVELTNRELMDMHEQLAEMSQRFFPNMTAELRISRLLQWVEPLARPLPAIRVKLQREALEEMGAEADKIGSASWNRAQARIAEVAHEFDSMKLRVHLPKARISEEMLPQVRAGERGEENAKARAAMRVRLGPLFEWPGE